MECDSVGGWVYLRSALPTHPVLLHGGSHMERTGGGGSSSSILTGLEKRDLQMS